MDLAEHARASCKGLFDLFEETNAGATTTFDELCQKTVEAIKVATGQASKTASLASTLLMNAAALFTSTRLWKETLEKGQEKIDGQDKLKNYVLSVKGGIVVNKMEAVMNEFEDNFLTLMKNSTAELHDRLQSCFVESSVAFQAGSVSGFFPNVEWASMTGQASCFSGPSWTALSAASIHTLEDERFDRARTFGAVTLRK
jgi:hypothetical protein